jgi:hypothetical protein
VGAQNGKGLSQVPMSGTFSNSKLNRSLALLKRIFSLDDGTRWMHEVTVEISLISRRNEQHCLGYWIDLDDARVSLGHQVGYKKALAKTQR